MTTVARIYRSQEAHWYTKEGESMHDVRRADGEGMRPTTLADAKKLGLLPSVTNVLRLIDKPALNSWFIEQAILAAVTSPRLPDEPEDAFIHRVMHQERQQDQEAAVARRRGTRIHDAMAKVMTGQPIPDDQDLCVWIDPVYRWLQENAGRVLSVETPLVGDGYAGTTDLVTERDDEAKAINLWDYKTCKKLPAKGGYIENKLQLSAYAHALGPYYGPQSITQATVRACNVFISTVEPGKFVVIEYSNEQLRDAYERGFKPLLQVWRYLNNFADH